MNGVGAAHPQRPAARVPMARTPPFTPNRIRGLALGHPSKDRHRTVRTATLNVFEHRSGSGIAFRAQESFFRGVNELRRTVPARWQARGRAR